MQLNKPVPWKQLGIAAAIGFSVLWFFEAWFYTHPLSNISGPMLALCPPSIALMASDNARGIEAFEILVLVSLANALIYSIAVAAILEIVAIARRIASR